MVRFVVRFVACATAIVAMPVAGAGLHRAGLAIGGALAVLATLWLWLWLPRTAHAAFEAGRFAVARRRYRLIGLTALSTARERAALLSRAGCAVADGKLAIAEQLLARLAAHDLAVAERAVWLNNRACVALASDPPAALALAEQASALRPDVPAVQHTRGMALLAVGRIDDAIAVLDGMRAGGELPARLEAERCRDLARAWSQKGQAPYAEDYQMRAQILARP